MGSRPLKVCLDSKYTATKIFKMVKRLGNTKYSGVTIRNDLTPMQLARLKDLKAELDRRKNDGELDITIKYVKGIPQIVKVQKNSN